MSSSSQPTEAASSRKRPRHFHAGPDETEEKEQRDEIAATAQSPAARLYRHALESIFGFLSLKDLGKVLQVSHSWLSAVDSMASISATKRSTHRLCELSASRLARHVSSLGSLDSHINLSQELLYLVSLGRRMSGLRSLYYKPQSPLVLPLLFPPSLTLLNLHALSLTTAAEVNSLISEVSRTSSLRYLALRHRRFMEEVDLSPLTRLTHLQELEFTSWTLSAEQIADLRALPQLTSLKFRLSEHELSELLRPPHELHYQELQLTTWPLSQAACPFVSLASLPSLTDLMVAGTASVAFLQHAPNLRNLKLVDLADSEDLLPPEQMIEGIGQCTQITSLTINNSELTSAHMAALLSLMPAVSKLELNGMPQLDSLSFLTSGPLQRSLTSLSLTKCHHAGLLTVELRHVFALQQLTHLSIRNSFAEKFNTFLLRELQVPSARLPNLIKAEVIEQ